MLHMATQNYIGDIDALRPIAAQMFQIMNGSVEREAGIGIAAPQVGLPLRMFVMDLTAKERRKFKNAYVCINPVILRRDEPLETESEGCLSRPGHKVKVKRHASILCSYTDLKGKRQTRNFFGLLARCFQHELDHLDGVTIWTPRASVSLPDALVNTESVAA